MKLRTLIFAVFGTFMSVLITALCVINLAAVRQNMREHAEEELIKYHSQVVLSAGSLLQTAIQSYLKGITDKNLELVKFYYNEYKSGRMTEQEAKDTLQSLFSRQTVGKTGYLVALERNNGKLILELHPYQKGVDCSDNEGCQAWDSVSNGIAEYDWQNPKDDTYRRKAAYVQEFKPWNWIIGASSYKDEFVDLVDIEELRSMIKPIRILKSGYFYVYDERNDKFLIHPELEGQSAQKVVDRDGKLLMKELINDPDGRSVYYWKNPSDKHYRKKFSYLTKLEWYDWYIAASGYVDEIYEPVAFLTNITIGIVIIALLLFIALALWFSTFLTNPLNQIKRGITRFNEEQLPFSWQTYPISEIDFLGSSAADMSNSLAASIKENRQTAFSLDQVINAMPSLIIKVTADLVITLCNRNAVALKGISPEELQGLQLTELMPELMPYRDEILEAVNGTDVQTFKYEFPGTTETSRYCEVTVIPLSEDDSGKAVLRIDDITTRLALERQLHQSQKMDAVGQLAGGIAHDFNNSLGGIIGAAELLKIGEMTKEEQNEIITLILTAAERAGELTKKLLTFSRKGSKASSAVECSKIVRETAALLQRTIDKSITVQVEDFAVSSRIVGDDSLIQNALMNMGINASHAMENGGTLSFTLRNTFLDSEYCTVSPFELAPGDYLEIEIRDTGCGMPPEIVSRIFEPFFTTKEQGKGTGLGMAAVYGTVLDHRGAITVYSEPGAGTVFRLYLPLDSSGADPVEQQEELPEGSGTILLADDDELIRITAAAILTGLGYHVICAENGREAVSIFEDARDDIDLVILDMIMPVMGGREAFAKLREIDPAVPVIIASGFAKDDDMSTMHENGASGFLHKPFRRAELAEITSKILGTAPKSQNI